MATTDPITGEHRRMLLRSPSARGTTVECHPFSRNRRPFSRNLAGLKYPNFPSLPYKSGWHFSTILSYLVDREPQFAAPHAVKFLSVPQLRTDACRILSMYPTPEAAVPLTELVRNPPGDNPNAVRSMAVLALGACGDADAVAVIKPYASQDFQNILSAQAIRALARIAGRHPEMRPRVRQVLMRCFPDFETGDNDRSNFAVRAFARDLNEALASCCSTKIPFPDQYDHKSGRKLQQRWSAVIDAEGREKPAP